VQDLEALGVFLECVVGYWLRHVATMHVLLPYLAAANAVEDEEDVVQRDGAEQVQEEPRLDVMLGYEFGVDDDLLAVVLLHDSSAKIDDDVDEEDGVREAIECDPSGAQVVVEEGDGHGQDDKIGHE